MRELQTVVTYLEMKVESVHHVAPPSNLKLMLLRAENITLDFYRFLYDPWAAISTGMIADITDAELTRRRSCRRRGICGAYVGVSPPAISNWWPRADNVMDWNIVGLIRFFMGVASQWLLRRIHPRPPGLNSPAISLWKPTA